MLMNASRGGDAQRRSTFAGPHQWWPKFTASLTRGGVFYQPSSNNRDAGGKLRLMYEANPMAMII
jgi:hypothetical protein